ncbi:MAG: hypothetical protein ACW98X_27035 [Promethearchaeota archaeon]|jgi:hypothetical protein
MNENQNKEWSTKDDILLITSRHRGIDYQLNLLGRSRKAIKTRLSLLQKNGSIDDTVIITAGDHKDNGDLQKKYIGVIEWCEHITQNYELSSDDIQLLLLVFDCK